MGLEKARAATLIQCDFSKAKPATVMVKYDILKVKEMPLWYTASPHCSSGWLGWKGLSESRVWPLGKRKFALSILHV